MKSETDYQNIHKDLIEKCKMGDTKAQFKIYELYYKAMYNVSYRIVNDTMEAEEIMQDAFLKAFDKLDTFSGTVSFGAWLKKIVINKSLDALKKRKVDFQSIDDQEVEIAEKSETNGHTNGNTQWKANEIKKAIMKLPAHYRTVVSLYLIEGYDHDEISEILGIPNSTSRSQLTRAKQRLKKLLNF